MWLLHRICDEMALVSAAPCRFSINLCCKDGNNAFHFNPRFEPSDVVVFNTFRNGSWENEERVEDMPIQPGDSFELVFIVTSEGYQVRKPGTMCTWMCVCVTVKLYIYVKGVYVFVFICACVQSLLLRYVISLTGMIMAWYLPDRLNSLKKKE